MDSELAALAASGATTLVSLMVTDSWTRARELIGRFLERTGSDTTAITDLDNARARLFAADATEDEQAITDVRVQWHRHLQQRIEAGTMTSSEIRHLLTSLQQLEAASASRGEIVRNSITGGVQHGPVIQSGRITGLTFHAHQPPAPDKS